MENNTLKKNLHNGGAATVTRQEEKRGEREREMSKRVNYPLQMNARKEDEKKHSASI